jgi:hypothetical protein
MSAHFVGVAHLDALADAAASGPRAVDVDCGRVSGDPAVALPPGVSAAVLNLWEAIGANGGRLSLLWYRREVFELLRAENFRSLRARYPGHDDGRAGGMWHPEDETAVAAVPAQRLEAVTIIKACHGFRYQACESHEWGESLAAAIVEAIEAAAVHRLPGYDRSNGWHLEDSDVHGSTPRGAVRAIMEEIEYDRRNPKPAAPAGRPKRKAAR